MKGQRTFIALFSSLALASPVRPRIQNLATFPYFIENIAIRSGGDLLVTSLGTPSVQHLNPKLPNDTTALPPIPNANGISGITEIDNDIFAVAAGIWNTTTRRSTQSAIWTLDFRKTAADRPVLKKVVDVQDTTALNGLTTVPGSSVILSSDSNAGAIYRIDIAKQTYSIAIQDEAFAPTGPAPSLGINGVRVHNSFLYFCNSATGLFGRVPISHKGTTVGPIEYISQFNYAEDGGTGIDDFAIDERGDAWITLHPDQIVKVDLEGRQHVVAKGSQVSDPTSLVFGRGYAEQDKVYFTTNIFGTEVVGGVAMMDLTSS